MWKAQVNKSIKEIRFALRTTPENIGAWGFVNKRLPELRLLNQNTFFSLNVDEPETQNQKSKIFILYGDEKDSEDVIETAGLSKAQVEQIIKEKVAYGLTLPRVKPEDNSQRSLPIEIVEAHKYVKYLDDEF